MPAASRSAGRSAPERLVAAAEELFAERGIDAVSLREINRAAEQGNASALQYHFGDRAGLLRAVLAKHAPAVEARRHALLDRYVDHGSSDLRELAAAFVEPLAAELGSDDGGRAYLRVVSELVNRPEPHVGKKVLQDPSDSTYRWRRLLDPMLSADAVKVFHVRFTAVRVAHLELARRAAAPRRRDDRLFTSWLVDLVAAVLAAPPSTQTERLLDRRRSRRR